MKLLFPATFGLLLLSCHESHQSAIATEKNSSPKAEKIGAATISASPNPVPAGGELGETTITWNAANNETAEVYVSKNDGAEQRFGAGQSGSEKAKWIRVHTRFEFRLYEGTAHRKVLAKVQVLHK